MKWAYIRRLYDILNVWWKLGSGPISTGEVYWRFRVHISGSKILERERNLILRNSKTSSSIRCYIRSIYVLCPGEPLLNVPVSKLRNIPRKDRGIFRTWMELAKIIEQLSGIIYFCKQLHVRCLTGFWLPGV